MNGNGLNFAELWLTHVHIHPSTTLHTDKIGHVTSDTRPSRFSVCNIEKLGMGLGMRLCTYTVYLYIHVGTYFVQNIRTQLCHSSQCQVEVIYDVVSDPKVPVNSLIVLENMDNDIKHYFVGENQDNATHSGGVLMSGLTKGLYDLHVFEFLLYERGLPSRIPANPQSRVINISTMADSGKHTYYNNTFNLCTMMCTFFICIDGSNIDKRPVHLKEFKHTGGGCFQCWFLSNSSASHCAVVVHTLDEVVNASLFERHGDRAEGCIVVDSPDWYYVVVLAYTNETIHERPYVAGKIPLLSMQGTVCTPILSNMSLFTANYTCRRIQYID